MVARHVFSRSSSILEEKVQEVLDAFEQDGLSVVAVQHSVAYPGVHANPLYSALLLAGKGEKECTCRT